MQSVREATLALIAELGADAVTTVKIAERAGISPGSLYRYYPNKQAIFTDIYNEELANLDKFMQDPASSVSLSGTLEEDIHEVAVLTNRFYRELLSLHGGFFAAYHRQFDFTLRENPENQHSWRDEGREWMVTLLNTHRHRLRVDDIEAAAVFLMDLATGYYQRIIEVEPKRLDDPAIIDQLDDLFCRYLISDQ
ncbi:HTH-type transcriptional repressor Bm3R1 [Halioglobus japonicus]|nr:HTH-type transcriptional repressor Bm3R1 [Halioglobus japonicus]